MKRRKVAHRQRYFQHDSGEHPAGMGDPAFRGDPAGIMLLTEEPNREGEGRELKKSC